MTLSPFVPENLKISISGSNGLGSLPRYEQIFLPVTSSQASPIPLLLLSSCPKLATSGQLSLQSSIPSPSVSVSLEGTTPSQSLSMPSQISAVFIYFGFEMS